MSPLVRLACAASLALLTLGTRAEACRGPFPPLEEKVKRAALVFVGVLTEVREEKNERIFVFTVEETLKGTAQKTVSVRSDTSTCGFGHGAQTKRRYLIFASGEPLATSAVSGNQLEPSGKDLEAVRGALAAAKR